MSQCALLCSCTYPHTQLHTCVFLHTRVAGLLGLPKPPCTPVLFHTHTCAIVFAHLCRWHAGPAQTSLHTSALPYTPLFPCTPVLLACRACPNLPTHLHLFFFPCTPVSLACRVPASPCGVRCFTEDGANSSLRAWGAMRGCELHSEHGNVCGVV